MVGITIVEPSAASTRLRPGKRRRASASARAPPRPSDSRADRARLDGREDEDAGQVGPDGIERGRVAAGPEQGREATRHESRDGQGHEAPGMGQRVSQGPSAGRGVEPAVREGAPVLQHLLGREEQRLSGLHHVLEDRRRSRRRGSSPDTSSWSAGSPTGTARSARRPGSSGRGPAASTCASCRPARRAGSDPRKTMPPGNCPCCSATLW